MANIDIRQFNRDIENRSSNNARRTSPRKQFRNRVQESPKSPLRSPLRTETFKSKQNYQNKRQKRNIDSKDSEGLTWNDEDYPPLSEDSFTPESGKWLSEGRKLDWSAEVEQEEERQERSRRKLDLREKISENTSDLRQKVAAQKRKRIFEVETDEKLLTRRQKDIDYGKNTVAYDRYSCIIPVEDYLNMQDIEDPLEGSSQLSSIQEDPESLNASDAEDEDSQTSDSPGITLTPDCKNNPFKYPKSLPSASSTGPACEVKVEVQKDDDGFFSGIDMTDMDTS